MKTGICVGRTVGCDQKRRVFKIGRADRGKLDLYGPLSKARAGAGRSGRYRLSCRGIGVKAAHHALVAHGIAVKLYRQTGLNGKIGVALDIVPKTAGSERSEDKYAAEVANATESFYFYDAIVKGAYPELAVKVLKEKNYWNSVVTR